MTNQIEAIIFDMGGTLRSTSPVKPDERRSFLGQMLDLVSSETSEDEFSTLLAGRAAAYKQWAEESLVELSEQELWTTWMLPDLPAGRIAPLAIQLNRLYRAATGTRTMFPETYVTLLELFRRGYRLGLVSNTTSSVEAHEALSELHIAGCFETIILSTKVGKRKPDPAILLEATGEMGVPPEHCVYVGNRVDRDVAAARKAGFAQAIILKGSEDLSLEGGEPLEPDLTVESLADLLKLFPVRPAPQPAVVYNASLSTMWAIRNFPTLPDFFEAARRLGFARIELNHKINSDMLAGIDLDQYQFSSVHEPCPADIDEAELKKRDWLISSTNEACRQAGVRAIMRSIDLAKRVGAGVVVIHAGHTTPDRDGLEKNLRAMIDTGQQDSQPYRDIQKQMVRLRSVYTPASFASVQKSIQELLDYAAPLGICLGIENRYHYLEHPSPNELGVLLNLAGQEQIGFLYDVGHAQTLDRLGFFPHLEWLDRFASRIVGAHLHDVVGVGDHRSPGTGEVDFARVSTHIPKMAVRTLELNNALLYKEVKSALSHLAQRSCILRLNDTDQRKRE